MAILRALRSAVGRGIRSPDACCTIYILDERYKSLGQFLPERFKDSWTECGRREVVQSVAERSPSHRKAALKHYGCKCYSCGFAPASSHLIDIHHLDPIAEGERETKFEDLIPLCPTCHRQAHSQRPPMQIEDLKAWASENKP
jgi:predicted HNH restriction endonuclease